MDRRFPIARPKPKAEAALGMMEGDRIDKETSLG